MRRAAAAVVSCIALGCSPMTAPQEKSVVNTDTKITDSVKTEIPDSTGKTGNTTKPAVPVTIDLLKKGPWVFSFYDTDWEKIPGHEKQFTQADSISIIDSSITAAYYGVDGLLTESVGAFDSLVVEYKSNAPFMAVMATQDDENGWETKTIYPASPSAFSRVTIRKADFSTPWSIDQKMPIDSADITAFSHDHTTLNGGLFSFQLKSVTLYTKK